MIRIKKFLSIVLAVAFGTTAFAALPFSAMTANASPTIVHPDSVATALAVAEEGTTLLRNTGVLPLVKSDKVALVGNEKILFGGMGSGWVNSADNVDYSTALKSAASAGDLRSFADRKANEIQTENKALYVITRNTTENEDRPRSTYYLTDGEKNEINLLCSSVGAENVVVLLNVGSVMDTTWLIQREVGAIVACYYGGSQAGNALSNVLCGKVSPSGKTVDTWAKDLSDYPSESIGTYDVQNYVKYTEDVYVGYRYFETFDKEYERVNYEFGFGLSYTDFAISDRTVDVNGGVVTLSATVRNVGNFSGKEVLQAYYSAPQSVFGTPAKQLGGFVKTDLLAPGQSQRMTITFDVNDMAVYDDTGKFVKDAYVFLAGDYDFYLGNSVKNAGLTGFTGTFKQAKNQVVEQLSELPQTNLDKRLLADGTYEKLSDTADSVSGAVKVRAGGSTVIQAEDYSDKSESSSFEAFSCGTDSGRGIGNLNRLGGFLEYKLDVEKAGTYNILFAMATQYDDQTDMFTVTVDGVRQPVVASLATKTHTEADGKWYECVPVKESGNKITLPQGECTLRFASNGLKFQNIDFFVIYTNDIATSGETTFDAEVGTSSTGIIHGADNFVTGYSGEAGNKYTFTVVAPAAGKYDLSVAASCFEKASERGLGVTVSGKSAGYIPLYRTSVTYTNAIESNKFNCRRSASLVVDLVAGTNVIELTTTDNTLGCLDALYVSPSDGSPIYSGFADNTEEFGGDAPSNAGKTLDKLITYNDVLFDNTLLDDFISQLSIEDLVYLHGTDEANRTGEINTGGVGGYLTDKKFGIPNAYTSDGPAGIRMLTSTATWFPCMTMLASTWNTEVAASFGRQVGLEAVAADVNVWLAPGVNIHRHPQCGRNFEYFSEDPIVAGKMGAAVASAAQSTGISVCVKHFCANNQETCRYVNDSRVSNRALREIYLKPFEIVIKEGGAYAVMSSYNMVNGTYVAANRALVTDVLRTDWGFEGAVFGDWTPTYPHIPLIAAGNNFKSFNAEYGNLFAAYRSRVIMREQLENNVRSTLKFLMLTNCNGQKTFRLGSATDIPAVDYAAERQNGNAIDRMYRVYSLDEATFDIQAVGTSGLTLTVDGEAAANGSYKLTKGLHTVIVRGTAEQFAKMLVLSVTSTPGEDDNHDFGEWTVVSEATCITDGYKQRVCKTCGAEDVVTIPATGEHNYANGVCTVCGGKKPAHVHVFGEWTVTTEATCTHKGQRTRMCGCGASEIEDIPQTVHSYVDGVCEVCGAAEPGYQPPQKQGCNSSLVGGGAALLALGALGAGVVCKRKKDDESDR